MRTITMIMVLIAVLMLDACQNSTPTNNNIETKTKTDFLSDSNWVEVTDTSSLTIGCLDAGKMYNLFKIVLRNQEEYDNLIDTLKSNFKAKNYDCDDYIFPEIDFERFSLISLLTRTGFCEIIRNVYRNDVKKEIYYLVDITNTGLEEILISNDNMLKIPKIPSDYTIVMDTIMRYKFD